ncbi:GatB/YqeY domain-containing protein [Patescibacteria group bacterium]|nr:GatB/YqeY domain-containing protein [Patescibacteria group bacterium]
MSEQEIQNLVARAIEKTGASMQDIGKVMGALMPHIKGKADGNLVSRIVKEKLAT